MNLADLVRRTAERVPDRDALLFQNRGITFAELDERIDLTAGALASLGVARGDRVALLAGNVPEFVSTFYGILRAGAVACPLNVMLTPEELRYILRDAGAKVVVTELETLQGLLSIRRELTGLGAIVVIGGPPAPAGTISLEEALGTEAEAPAVDVAPSSLAAIAYTAGTTASPKGAMLTHANLLANLEQMDSVESLRVREDDVVLLALPLFHIYALNAVLGPAVRAGATCLLVERFDPAETLRMVERHGVTLLVGAPPMFAAWLDADLDATADLSSVRLAVSGAAPLPAEVMTGFRDRFGVTIWEGYGLTEAAPAVTTNAVGPEAKPASIGLPLPGLEVRLVDEQGEDVEDGDPGEILVKGPNIFSGYWGRDDATSDVLAGDWLRTGDVAYRDEDGYLFLVDRKKDLVIVSGFNVFPKEVEEAIEQHPDVEEAAVVGVPDERTGEAVQAWVVPVEGRRLDDVDVLGFLRDKLARFKWPRDIRIVDELPHHVTGKVLRRALRGEEVLGQPGGSTAEPQP